MTRSAIITRPSSQSDVRSCVSLRNAHSDAIITVVTHGHWVTLARYKGRLKPDAITPDSPTYAVILKKEKKIFFFFFFIIVIIMALQNEKRKALL